MLGDVVSEEAVTKFQTFAQQLQNLERKPRRRRRDFLDQVPTTRQQMIQTALVERLQKPVIDFPPVVMQPTLPLRPQYRRCFFEAAARKDVVDRYGFRDYALQPLECRRHAPARLVHPGDIGLSDDHAQLLISRSRFLSHSNHGAADTAAAHLQTPAQLHYPRRSSDSPISFLKCAASDIACGPICTPAAPSASEVCNSCRPCILRPQQAQCPISTSKRRTIILRTMSS